MNQPTYKVEYLPDEDHYIFESVGPQGVITKVVMFSEIFENKKIDENITKTTKQQITPNSNC